MGDSGASRNPVLRLRHFNVFWTPAFAGVTLFGLGRYEPRKGIFTINGHGGGLSPPQGMKMGNTFTADCPLPTAD
jgi:hypothetical protein